MNQVVGLSSCAGLPGALSDFTSKATQALQDLNSGKGTMIYFMYPGGSVTLSVDAAWGPAASAAWTAYHALQLGKGIGGCLVTLAEGSPVGLALEGLTAGLAVYISTRPAYTLQVTPSPIRSTGESELRHKSQCTSRRRASGSISHRCSSSVPHLPPIRLARLPARARLALWEHQCWCSSLPALEVLPRTLVR